MGRGSAHNATIIAGALVVVGFVLIFLGYRGGAGFVFVPTQIAYGVSGGLAGVAVLGIGLAIANVQFTRLHTARRSAKLRVLLADTVDVLTMLRQDPAVSGRSRATLLGLGMAAPLAGQSTGEAMADPGSSRPPGANNNGQGRLDDHAPFRPPLMFLAGRTVFHQPGCRTLTRVTDPVQLSITDAHGRGLAPCRICQPQA